MALIPVVLAIVIGVGLGVRRGGRVQNIADWRPAALEIGLSSLAVIILLDLFSWSGGIISLLRVVALGGLTFFAVVNVRVGGMIIVAGGLGITTFVTLINGGTPVSMGALESSGIIPSGTDPETIVLTGGRSLNGTLGFLGDVIPLPWGQVISIPTVLTLIGVALVISSLTRRYHVGGSSYGPQRRSRGYNDALSALSKGPAPRHGPGLHPSRMPHRGRPRRGSGSSRPE